MLDVESIQQRLLNLFSESLDRDVPSLDTDLLETGLIDSLSLVDLLMNLESEFGLTVDMSDIDLEQLRTVIGLSILVREWMASSATTSAVPPAVAAH